MKSYILRTLAVLMLLIVVACGGGISEESYNKVEVGMTMQEVKDILGDPTSTDGAVGLEVMGKKLSGGMHTWKSGTKEIMITFASDKVTLKAKNGF
ncbi:MAG: hypothetical protein ACI97A_003856 [Planctomycetota bacterium]|jgi:hypothetical protein